MFNFLQELRLLVALALLVLPPYVGLQEEQNIDVP